jgi:hypothetical protein
MSSPFPTSSRLSCICFVQLTESFWSLPDSRLLKPRQQILDWHLFHCLWNILDVFPWIWSAVCKDFIKSYNRNATCRHFLKIKLILFCFSWKTNRIMNYVNIIFIPLLPSKVSMCSDVTYLRFDIFMLYKWLRISMTELVVEFLLWKSDVLRNEYKQIRVCCRYFTSLWLTFKKLN